MNINFDFIFGFMVVVILIGICLLLWHLIFPKHEVDQRRVVISTFSNEEEDIEDPI
jgi:hypothetical protein